MKNRVGGVKYRSPTPPGVIRYYGALCGGGSGATWRYEQTEVAGTVRNEL